MRRGMKLGELKAGGVVCSERESGRRGHAGD